MGGQGGANVLSSITMGILGGGTQDTQGSYGQDSGASGDTVGKLLNAATADKGQSKAYGAGYGSLGQSSGSVGNVSVTGSLGGIDAGFYAHPTVTSCRKDATITGAGDVFHKTKEDKAFSRTSNLSSKKGDCRKAK